MVDEKMMQKHVIYEFNSVHSITWTLDFSKIKEEKDSEWLDDRW